MLPCDVQQRREIDAVFADDPGDYGGLDFLVHGAAFAPREEITGAFLEYLARRLPHGARHQRLLADCAGARRAAADGARGGGSILTLTYLGSDRVFPNYNVMGVAKAALESSVRYLASDLGPQNIRVNAISAGPVKTLAAAGIGGFSSILGVVREKAPLRRSDRNVRSRRCRGVPVERRRRAASPAK